AGKQMLQSLVVHDKHDQVHSLYADLQTPATASHRHECWRAPAAGSAACRYASPMFTTENEAAFDQVGNYDHAFGAVQHLFRNPVIRSSHDCLEHFGGGLQAIHRVLFPRSSPRASSSETHKRH